MGTDSQNTPPPPARGHLGQGSQGTPHPRGRRALDTRASTEFTYSHFLVPHLRGFAGKAILMDSDMLCFDDTKELDDLDMDGLALRVVQRDDPPDTTVKSVMFRSPGMIHHTRGGPWFAAYRDHPHAEVWYRGRGAIREPARSRRTN